jgi:predicted kinase
MYVVVTGIPGSGKSTLAAPLAAALGYPLIDKDSIKETLWDALGPGDRAWSRRLGAASMEVLWRLAAQAPDAVLDAFIHRDQRPRLAALGGQSPVVEVHCSCAPGISRTRYAERRRHESHFDAEQLDDVWDRWCAEDAEPLGVGRLVEVDMTEPVDLPWLVDQVR